MKFFLTYVILFITILVIASPPPPKVHSITVLDMPEPEQPEYAIFQELAKKHPNLRFKRYTQLKLPNSGRGSLMLSVAGGMAPDILRVYHHEAQSWIRNGFLMPLDKWIYIDTDKNGRYTDGVDEIIWEPFKRIPKDLREVIMKDGHIYLLPRFRWMQGIIYRKDLMREYGVDPDKEIKTFDDLLLISRKLTDPNAKIAGARRPAGRKGFAMMPDGWTWQGFLYASGGKASQTVLVCPKCAMSQALESIKCGRCGASLKACVPVERAAFNSPAGMRALKLWQHLLWAPYVKDPKNGQVIDLKVDSAGQIKLPLKIKLSDGSEMIIKSRSDPRLIIGCSRPVIGEDADWKELFVNGEIVMFARHKEFLSNLENTDLDPRVIGFMPLPEQGGLTAYHYWGVYSEAPKREGKLERAAACAKLVLDYATQFYVPKNSPHYLEYDKFKIRRLVEMGCYNFCTRDELNAAGMKEYIQEISRASLDMWDLLYDEKHSTLMSADEGYSRVQTQVFGSELLSNLVVSPDNDLKAMLNHAELLANTQVYEKDERVRYLVNKYRWMIILIIAAVITYVFILIYFLILRKSKRVRTGEGRKLSTGKRLAGIILLLPAILLIAVWSYYPLARGSIMAFQDVKLLGDSTFVGLENFIRVIANPQFFTVIKATLLYVFAVLSIGFFTPILLAVLLSEVRRFSVFYRVIYYAPHLLSGVVVLFIWKIFYMPTVDGFLNQVLAFFHIDSFIALLNDTFNWQIQYPVHWLQNVNINKWALAFPSIWASAGSGCLVYLAALKGIDQSAYEAADIDGAGVWAKMIHITIPCLKPLIVIQFVSAFIAAFHGMGNILVLTGGAYDTNVIGLQIWLESFAFLRFGNAIALAWMLGSILVSFTIIQLRILRRVEYRRAE